jgi:osmoprotectant transport system permease protein
MTGVGLVAAVFSYLCIPGHPLGTFFYDHSPLIFRESISYLQTPNAFGESTSVEFWREVANHVTITLVTVGFATAVCFPLGILGSRIRLLRTTATNVVGIARGVPGVAVLFLMYPWLGTGERPAVVALVILAAPPIFLNTVAAYAGVDDSVVEAARGMGMGRLQSLVGIETPLAAPVIVAGIRTATVEVIASATIAAYINFDSLGSQISAGVQFLSENQGHAQLAIGIFAVTSIALLAELILTGLQRLVTPRTA